MITANTYWSEYYPEYNKRIAAITRAVIWWLQYVDSEFELI